jgi:tetratricopeptide (TPR) repeat protein
VFASAFLYFITLEIGTALATDPSLQTHHQLKALGMIERGNLFAQHGMIDEAVAAYEEGQNMDPELALSASDWNRLCWYGGLWGYAEDVLDVCDRAVALEPDNGEIKDSRGLARALTGDYDGAIEDFGAYVDWLEEHGGDDYEKNLRQFWISELETGRNPIDETILMELR